MFQNLAEAPAIQSQRDVRLRYEIDEMEEECIPTEKSICSKIEQALLGCQMNESGNISNSVEYTIPNRRPWKAVKSIKFNASYPWISDELVTSTDTRTILYASDNVHGRGPRNDVEYYHGGSKRVGIGHAVIEGRPITGVKFGSSLFEGFVKWNLTKTISMQFRNMGFFDMVIIF